MQIKKKSDMEINLKDLLFFLLYRWRSILLVALICAAAFCGYQYLSIKATHDAGKLTKEERQYQIDLQQYGEDLATNRNTVKVYSKLIQEQNDYLEKSIYINLAPQNVWVASNKYLISVEKSADSSQSQLSSVDPADNILPAYSAPLSGITDEEKLKATFGTDEIEFVSELVITQTNPEENTVSLYVLGETKEYAQAGLSLLHQQMLILSKGKAQEIAPHQLILVSENVSRGEDSISRGMSSDRAVKINLATKQEALGKSTEQNQKILQTARQQVDKLETNGEPKAPGMHLPRMAVIGFIIGAVLMLVIYLCVYGFRGKVNSAEILTERYGLPLLGEIPNAGNLHACKGLDKVFANWEIGKDSPGSETVYDNICALISKNEEAQAVLLVSTLPEKGLAELWDAIKTRLPEKTIDTAANMLHNSEAIPEAMEADEVIIVEKRHFSRLKDVDRMVETLSICNAKTVGCVVL